MSIAGGVSQAIDRAASIQSNAVQVFTKNNRQWAGPPIDEEDVERWRAQMPAHGIVYAVSHASYLINLASPDPANWDKSMRAHRDELERAYIYGIPHVVLHPGAHMKSGEEAGLARVAAALNIIHAQTPACAETLTLLELMAGQGTCLGKSFWSITPDYRTGRRSQSRSRLCRYLPRFCDWVRVAYAGRLRCAHRRD